LLGWKINTPCQILKRKKKNYWWLTQSWHCFQIWTQALVQYNITNSLTATTCLLSTWCFSIYDLSAHLCQELGPLLLQTGTLLQPSNKSEWTMSEYKLWWAWDKAERSERCASVPKVSGLSPSISSESTFCSGLSTVDCKR
jgi:hypothetical protein